MTAAEVSRFLPRPPNGQRLRGKILVYNLEKHGSKGLILTMVKSPLIPKKSMKIQLLCKCGLFKPKICKAKIYCIALQNVVYFRVIDLDKLGSLYRF